MHSAYKRGRKIAILLVVFLLLEVIAPFAALANPPQAGWQATPYHKEDGTLVEGLEAAVAGKSHWLEATEAMPATANEEDGVLRIENGIIQRDFSIPKVGETGFYTKSYKNLYIDKELMREGIKPDATIALYDVPYKAVYEDKGIVIKLDSISSADNTIEIPENAIKKDPDYFFVGGEQTESTFVFNGYTVQEKCEKPFDWSPNTIYGDPAAEDWPPKGKNVVFNFSAPNTFPQAYRGVKIKVIYEMYDNLSVMKKRVEVTNTAKNQIMVGRLAPEILNGNESMDELLTMETSYTCGDQSTLPVNRPLPCKCGLEKAASPFKELEDLHHSCYEVGPAYELVKDQTLVSFDTYELIHSTYWFELKMREHLGMYRKLFPWVTDNPLTFHNTAALSKSAIDHAVEAGFEMIIQSYSAPDSSGQMLSRDKTTLDNYKALVDYAHSKKIAIGIYQAQYTRGQYKGGAEYGANGTGQWGTWCLASAAFDDYWDNFKYFVKYTGLDCVEIDGTYPGCYCNNGEKHKNTDKETDPDPAGKDNTAGTPSKYAFHNGVFDSQVKQWENGVRLVCKEFRDMGVYIKVPAWYYVNGGNKCGIGYEEAAWSQARQEQLLYGRQLMHNASYARTMSMSWSHIPFAQYHGGGSEAMFQPFKENKQDYNWVIAQNLGNGVVTDFRGSSLFDDETQGILNKWVGFYRRYRGIAGSDLVHISQATYDDKAINRKRGVKMDTLYHANANNPGEKGLLWVYNQTDEPRTETITVPMYYTGLTSLNYPPVPLKGSLGKDVHSYGTYPPNYSWLPKNEADYVLPTSEGNVGKAAFLREGVEVKEASIDANGNTQLTVTLPPMTFTYYAIYNENEVPDVSLKVGQVTGAKAEAVKENTVTLRWDENVEFALTENGVVNQNPAITVDSFNIYRNDILQGSTMDNLFVDEDLTESTQYSYTIGAVASGIKGAKSEPVVVETETDTTKPQVVNITATSEESILLTFSEQVDGETGGQAGNYTLSGGKKVQSASVTGRQVRLKVDALEPLTAYTLSVKNVKDKAAAGNVMEPLEQKVVYGYIAKFGFEQVADGNISDSWGNYDGKAHSIEAAGNKYSTTGKFDATKNAYGDLGTGLLSERTEYTIGLWFNPMPGEKQVLLSQGQENILEEDISLWLEGDTLHFRAADKDGKQAVLSGGTAQLSGWNLASVVRQEEGFALYLNGAKVDETTTAGLLANEGRSALLLGAMKNHAGGARTFYYNGMMSEAALYSVALSGEQISQTYEAGLDGLAALLEEANAVNASLFTQESYGALKTAAEEIEAADPGKMLPEEVIAAKQRLETVLGALVKKPEYASLQGLYSMDEMDGSELNNALGGSAAIFQNGEYMRVGTPFKKGAYLYEKLKNYVLIPQNHLKEANNYTLSGWFKSQLRLEKDQIAAGKQVLFSDAAGGAVLSLQKDVLSLELYNGAETTSLTASKKISYAAGTGGEVRPVWNNFSITKSGNDYTLYLNGEAVATGALAGVAMGDSAYIGAQKDGASTKNQYNGIVDEFAFYTEALDSERIAAEAKEIPFNKATTTNLALKKTLNGAGMSDAYRLNDGLVHDMADEELPWTARSGGAVGNSGLRYGIDLGQTQEIHALSLTQFYRNYNNVEVRRFRDVVLQVSTSENFTTGVTTLLNTDSGNRLGQGIGTDATFYSFELGYDIVLEKPVQGRYVRLINSGFYKLDKSYAGYVNVAELEVYGKEQEPAEADLSLSREKVELVVAKDREFVKLETDENTSASSVKATSADETVATVINKNGILQITAVAQGKTQITVSHPEKETLTKTIQVEVLGHTPSAVIDDGNPDIVYAGVFAVHNTGRGPDPDGVYEYDKGIHLTNEDGASAEYTFTGTGIDVITTVNIDQGKMQILLDGKEVGMVQTETPNDTHPKRANQMCVYSTTDLPYGEHTIKIVNAPHDTQYGKNSMTVDAFRVYVQLPEVDKTALQTLYEQVEAYKQAEYTPESWADFATALQAAKTTLEKEDATQQQVDDAKGELQKTVDALQPALPVSKEDLKALVDSLLLKNSEEYTTGSWMTMMRKLQQAQAVLEDTQAEQQHINTAKQELQTAADALQVLAVDKTALEAALVSARETATQDTVYTPEGIAGLNELIAQAQGLFESDAASRADVEQMVRALQDAAVSLPRIAPLATLEELCLLANTVRIAEEAAYTAESWAPFAQALQAADELLGVPETEDSALLAARDTLKADYMNLVLRADFSELETAIDLSEKLLAQLDKYAPASITSALPAKLEIAKALDANSSQQQVDESAQALTELLLQTYLKADKTALAELVAQAEKYDLGKYTPETGTAMTQALQSAREGIADTDLKQVDANSLFGKLKKSLDELEEKQAKIAVTAVSLDKQTLSLKVGETDTLKALITPADADDKTVDWISDNPGIVLVESEGTLRAIEPGTANITVITKDGEHTASCAVTVIQDAPAAVAVESVRIGQKEISLATGDTASLAATVLPENAENKAVVWSSSDAAVARVEKGNVTALKAGKATITVQTEDGNKTDTCSVTVTDPVVKVSKVTLNMTNKTLKKAGKVQLKATISPASATDKNVVWSSSNTKVARVSSKGLVTAIKDGNAKITATVDGQKATASIRVGAKLVAASKVKLSARRLVLNSGAGHTLKATVTPAKASNKKVLWSSSDAKVATVNKNGKVSAKSPGKTTITVTTQEGGCVAKCTITVKAAVRKMQLNKTKATLKAKQTLQLKTTILPKAAVGGQLTYTSSNPKVASVNSKGKITALKKGKTTITVATGGRKVRCVITVK